MLLVSTMPLKCQCNIKECIGGIVYYIKQNQTNHSNFSSTAFAPLSLRSDIPSAVPLITGACVWFRVCPERSSERGMGMPAVLHVRNWSTTLSKIYNFYMLSSSKCSTLLLGYTISRVYWCWILLVYYTLIICYMLYIYMYALYGLLQ